jgi:hypothetical protein
MPTRAKLPVLMIAALQLTGNQAMSQLNCDVVKIAKDYVETHFPFIDTAPDRRVVTLPIGAYWQVTFKLPERYLGFVPEITVDPNTCRVVSAKVWQ